MLNYFGLISSHQIQCSVPFDKTFSYTGFDLIGFIPAKPARFVANSSRSRQIGTYFTYLIELDLSNPISQI